MENWLSIAPEHWGLVEQHLFQNEVEQVAIAFADVLPSTEGVGFSAREIHLLGPNDFSFQSAYHIEVSSEAQARIIKMAWDRQSGIVEFHSHVSSNPGTRFSPSDMAGFTDFVPHVWWRLRARPYLAVVRGRRDFDALVWRESPTSPESLRVIRVGSSELIPTGLSLGAYKAAS